MATNSRTITTHPDDATKLSLAENIFKSAYDPLQGLAGFNDYFRYYCSEIDDLQFGYGPANQAANLALRTHLDLIEVVKVVRANPKQTRPQLRDTLRRTIFQHADDICINRAIDVSLRLWLMVNIREEEFRPRSTLRRPCIQWDEKLKLDEFFANQFSSIPRWEPTAREGRYDPNFTAAFMVDTCGLKLDWTTSLEDHLRLDRGTSTKPSWMFPFGEGRTKTLWIFPFKTYLVKLQKDQASFGAHQSSIIPPSTLDETIKSLILLFPHWDQRTHDLLDLHNQKFLNDYPSEHRRPLGINDFKIWRDRLLELYQEIYQAPTPGWKQLWKDRRNLQQWSTFWLALLIAIMTLVSMFTGFVSMIASCKQAWWSGSA